MGGNGLVAAEAVVGLVGFADHISGIDYGTAAARPGHLMPVVRTVALKRKRIFQ
jgi:hypothetical protein